MEFYSAVPINLCDGYVYFIRNPSNSLIKVGSTEHWRRRFLELRRLYGDGLEAVALFGFIELMDARRAEKYSHNILREHLKYRREWFAEIATLRHLEDIVTRIEMASGAVYA